MVYQICTARLFLTWPQCPLSKDEVYEYLENFFRNLGFRIIRIVVAHELHANGDPHLHSVVELDQQFRTRDPRFADLPGGYHGKYEGCRSLNLVIKYCTKKDDYRANFDVASLIAPKQKRKQAMAELINGKRTLVELVNEQPEYLHGYTRLRQDFTNFIRDRGDKKPSLPTFLPNPWGLVLPSKVLSKRRHYWLYSDKPNVGKTYLFARPLREYNICHLSGPQLYFDLQGTEEAIILDEYNHAFFKWSELNAMCDGTYRFRLFMAGQIKMEDPIIIVLSNVSLNTLYPNMHVFLYERFKEIKLD